MSDVKSFGQNMVESLALDYVPGDYWTHYKGGVYQIVTLAVNENTGEPLIVYKSLKYGTVWVRTINNWSEMVELPTGRVPRFKRGAP